MTPYSIRFKASVEKDLRRIPARARSDCLERISRLPEDPRPRRAVRLTGAERTFRLRIGSYRVVYQVDEAERLIVIQYIRHRKDAYRR